MLHRSLALMALLPLFVLAACDDDDDDITGVQNTATVRFINATNNAIDARLGGTVGTGNGNLAFGTSSSCMTVNTTGTNGLSFTQGGTTTAIPGFTQNFTNGGNYTVIAYPSSTGTQFITVNNAGFTPNAGQAGLRIFNAASTAGNLVVQANGTAVSGATAVSYGNAGSFLNIPAGSQSITFNTGTGTTTVANAGNVSFTAGQTYTMVVAPAAPNANTLRTFVTQGC